MDDLSKNVSVHPDIYWGSVFLGIIQIRSSIVNIVTIAYFGLHGNRLYKYHFERKFKEISTTHKNPRFSEELIRQGGTNMGAAIGFGLLYVLIIIIFLASIS